MIEATVRRLAICIGLAGLLALTGCGPPSAKSLERRFHEERASFDRLVEMMEEDRFEGALDRYSREPSIMEAENTPLSPERKRQYMELMIDLGFETVARWPVDRGKGHYIWCTVHSRGILRPRFRGYKYLSAPPKRMRTVPSLDSGTDSYEKYQKLTDHWFLSEAG